MGYQTLLRDTGKWGCGIFQVLDWIRDIPIAIYKITNIAEYATGPWKGI